MVIGALLKEATEKLSVAGIETARLDSEVLLSFLLKKDRLYLLINKNQETEVEIEKSFRELVERRAKNEPVAYIVGSREFMSLDFSVAPGVLIPRPDTETLVEFVMETLPKDKEMQVLDICTGSGAIGVSLAHYLPKTQVTAIDISDVCVKVATENAEKNGVAARFTAKKQDAFSLTGEALYDCVVSNPPYIPSAIIPTLEKDVAAFEPHLALDGGSDGYVFYRHLTKVSASLLKSGGLLAFEVGHDQAEAVEALLKEEKAYKITGTRQDLAGISRVVYGIKQ